MWNASAKTIWLWLLLAIPPASSAQPAAPKALTYEADVRPLLERHCVQCHRPGEVGPFPLDSFEAVSKRARLIAQVVSTGYMPPWKPTPASLPMLHSRRMPEKDKATITAWVSQGATRGTPAGKAKPFTPPTPSEGTTFALPEDFALPAASADIYRCFVIPNAIKESSWVRAFEFLPGNRKVVHHALVFFDLSGAARRLDRESPNEPGYPCVGTPGFLPSSSLGGWSPGNARLEQPAGTAVRAPAGADLVFQIHYHVTGKPETDRSAIRLEFSSTPPERRLLDIPLTSNLIDIPAGAPAYTVEDHFELPVDVTLQQIIPHAHFVARRMRAWATLPGKPRRTLLAIDDWDFNWQDVYQLAKPLELPAGTLLEMQITYDNSTRNPRNPFRPPQRIIWGPGLNDEMAGMHFNVTVDDEKTDLEDLTSSLWGKMIRATQRTRPSPKR